MYVSIHDSPARRGLSTPPRAERIPTDATCSHELATTADATVDHDATLLVAALEAVESRRATIEWLLEADLLRLCLV